MRDIERARREPGVPGVALKDLHGAEAVLGREFGRQGDRDRIRIHAKHPPVGRHPLGQQIQHAAGAAAEVDRALPRP